VVSRHFGCSDAQTIGISVGAWFVFTGLNHLILWYRNFNFLRRMLADQE
jgi:hypothetical protein